MTLSANEYENKMHAITATITDEEMREDEEAFEAENAAYEAYNEDA